ncbi:hypothetical protein BGE01nite_04250 [Brevifollis gellanilyticus]|uniref:Uncharacterized protein n=1 Tax=Brevifollis gellanilyticus TaxID=748831 RepID=A0A512M310_9BACT|nr:hypothetical protein BGE01nite_04250 [Brevifollis gellanilyticus]
MNKHNNLLDTSPIKVSRQNERCLCGVPLSLLLFPPQRAEVFFDVSDKGVEVASAAWTV